MKLTNSFLKKCAINHRGYYVYIDRHGKTRWLDDNKELKSPNERPCKYCGKYNIFDKNKIQSYDACLGKLPGVSNACCGHGLTNGYIMFKNGIRVVLARLGYERKYNR